MGFFGKKKPEDLNQELLQAASGNDVERAKALLAKGADVNSGGAYGPLYNALENEREEMTKFLLGQGANPNHRIGDDATLLMLAMNSWRHSLTEEMLKHGADVNLAAANGKTPLIKSIAGHRSEITRVMIEKGADVNVADPDGRLPLHVIAENSRLGLSKLVFDKTADINAVDAKGMTALHIAAKLGDANMVLRLMERGADATLADKEMKTAAVYAENGRFPGLAAILRGEQPDVRNGPPAGGWKLVAEDEIARFIPKNAIGYRVTEIFNFTARTYTQVLRNIETGAESQSVNSFSSVSEGGLVDAAYAALEKLGGKAPGRVPDKKKLAQPGAGT